MTLDEAVADAIARGDVRSKFLSALQTLHDIELESAALEQRLLGVYRKVTDPEPSMKARIRRHERTMDKHLHACDVIREAMRQVSRL